MKETFGLYIADTTDSIAIAFLIPLVCYGGDWRVCCNAETRFGWCHERLKK